MYFELTSFLLAEALHHLWSRHAGWLLLKVEVEVLQLNSMFRIGSGHLAK